MDKKNSIYGTLLVVAAGVLWGAMGIFVRRLNAYGFSSLQIVASRVTFSTVIMAAVLLIRDRRLFKISLRHIWCFIGTGICSIAFFSWCYFTAIELTSLSAAAVMLYTAPIIVMAMSLFLFKEKLTIFKVLAAISAFTGCVLVTGIAGDGFSVSSIGLLAGAGSAFGYALYSIFGRYAIDRGYGSMTITFWTFAFASIGLIPLSRPAEITQKLSAEPSGLLWVILMAIIVTVLPYLLYTAGLNRIESGKASVMASAEPVVATIVGAIAFDEKLTLSVIIGIALVILSIALLNTKQQNPES